MPKICKLTPRQDKIWVKFKERFPDTVRIANEFAVIEDLREF